MDLRFFIAKSAVFTSRHGILTLIGFVALDLPSNVLRFLFHQPRHSNTMHLGTHSPLFCCTSSGNRHLGKFTLPSPITPVRTSSSTVTSGSVGSSQPVFFLCNFCSSNFSESCRGEANGRGLCKLEAGVRSPPVLTGRLGMFSWKTYLSFPVFRCSPRICLPGIKNTSSRRGLPGRLFT